MGYYTGRGGALPISLYSKKQMNYTMEQINSFLYDALNEESLSANQIYETIIETVAEHTEYLQLQYVKSQQLFDLLKGTAKPYKSPWNEYWDNNKQDRVVKWRLPVEELETEYYITFPDDLLEAADLKEGDEIEWIDQNDGSYLIKKIDAEKDVEKHVENLL